MNSEELAFKYCSLDKSKLRRAVIETRSSRIPDILVSEFLYFYVAPPGSKIVQAPLKSDKKKLHQYLLWPNGVVVDLLVSEFPEENLNLEKTKDVKVPKVPGTDTKRLAELLGFGDDDLDIDVEDGE